MPLDYIRTTVRGCRSVRSSKSNGGTVYVADDAADANRYITEVLAEEEADSVVKSKSMTTEEIDLNEALEEDDFEV